MMNPISQSSILWSPMISIEWIGILFVIGMGLTLYAFLNNKQTMALIRFVLLIFFTVTLCNPLLTAQEKEKLDNIAVLINDQSPSNQINDRDAVTHSLYNNIKEQLQTIPNLQIREITNDPKQTDQTNIFGKWQEAINDIPSEQIAGTILISDGQIHDANLSPETLENTGPFHTVLSGNKQEKDRFIEISQAPSYGLAGQNIEVSLTIHDSPNPFSTIAPIAIRSNDQIIHEQMVDIGKETLFTLPMNHAGTNIFEISTPVLDGELTGFNNKTILSVQGVRDRLKVLLVSGLPHNGERVWRNLLKSDPNIDLVHFTILRSPEKYDGVPNNELALIPFPIEELFVQKIEEFDLIIFDRFTRFGLVPVEYINNIAKFVKNGGAFLDVLGPGSSAYPFFKTDLDDALPATPAGKTIEQAFTPKITETGNRHPITQKLSRFEDHWTDWFRQAQITPRFGHTLMTGANDNPLLVLGNVEQGRAAQLASDQIWLWARDNQGDTAHHLLLRRLAHWLMKEPELEENRIEATIQGRTINIDVFSIDTGDQELTITTPSGETIPKPIIIDINGKGSTFFETDEYGVYHLSTDTAQKSVIVGQTNSPELRDLLSTDQPMASITKQTKGKTLWHQDSKAPKVKMIGTASSYGGTNWIALQNKEAYRILSSRQISLITPLLGLLLLCGSLLIGWFKESR